MTKIDLQYDILNYTPATASPVEANFDRIEQHTNQELIERDGTVAMRAQLRLVGDPVAPLDAAPKQYVDQVLPVAVIMMYGGAGTPPGGRWALCNGAELQSASLPALYAIIGNSFSPAGTPAGRFHLPNLQGRVAVGAGAPDAVGVVGGSGDGALVAHTHALTGVSTGTPSGTHTHSAGASGGAHSHGFAATSLGANVRHQHNYLGPGLVRADQRDGGDVIRLALACGDDPSIEVRDVVDPQAVLQTGPDAPDHAHEVGGTTTSSASGGGGVTGTDTPGHTHAITGATASAGGATTGNNMPPYVAVSYIIRIS